MQFESYSAIAVNTSHIKPSTYDWLVLNQSDSSYSLCAFRDTGCFLKLHEELQDNLPSDVPAELANIIAIAWNFKVRLIEFDNAALVVEGLPTFEWD